MALCYTCKYRVYCVIVCCIEIDKQNVCISRICENETKTFENQLKHQKHEAIFSIGRNLGMTVNLNLKFQLNNENKLREKIFFRKIKIDAECNKVSPFPNDKF